MQSTRRRFLGAGTVGVGLCALPGWSLAQTPLDGRALMNREGRYLPWYLELQALPRDGSNQMAGLFPHFAAFVGDEAGSYPPATPRTATGAQLDLTNARARDALSTIVEAARTAQIVVLNEAHTVSAHRAFAGEVMRALRPLGFDWFAAESFANEGLTPISSYAAGRPFLHSHGFYTRDPVFAEVVREAIGLGYRLAAYEQRPDQRAGPDEDAISVREEAQAENLIAAVLRENPDARIFIHCGFSHVTEAAPLGGTPWFAARLKAKTGIDPLTIEQSSNWPGFTPDTDPLHVAAVLERFRPETPIVVDIDGKAFASRGFSDRVDLSVYHPRQDLVDGRADWRARQPGRKPLQLSPPAQDSLGLLQAIWADEGGMSVPADQVLVPAGASGPMTLYLRPGAYTIRMETPNAIQVLGGVEVT